MPDPFAVPCPPWCRRPVGHTLELAHRDVGGVARRVHLGQRVDGVELEQFETVDAAGQVTAGQVMLSGPAGRVPAAAVPTVLAGLAVGA